jgi:MFS family permease
MQGASSIAAGLLMKKLGSKTYKWLMPGGFCAMALALGLMINWHGTPSWPEIVFCQLLAAVGLALNYQPVMVIFQARLKQKDLATGQSTFQVVRTFSQALSLVTAQAIFQGVMERESRHFSGVPPEFQSALAQGDTVVVTSALGNLSPDLHKEVKQAVVISFNRMWIYYTAQAVVGIVASLLLKTVVLQKELVGVKTGLPREGEGEKSNERLDTKDISREETKEV